MVHGGIDDDEQEEEPEEQFHEWRERFHGFVTALFPVLAFHLADPVFRGPDEGGFMGAQRFKDGLGITDRHPDSKRQKQWQVWNFLPP